MIPAGKNLRLLGQEAPPWRQPTVQEEIAALTAELAKGGTVYTAEEIRYLAKKLAEQEERLWSLSAGG